MLAGVTEEILRLEHTLAMVSIDHGRGRNPNNLDVPRMERCLVMLRAYRELSLTDIDPHLIVDQVRTTQFGDFATTDREVANIREEYLSE